MSFYRDVPVLEGFAAVADTSAYVPVPDDWFVAISDVVDSTGAIRRGQYRDINVLGAASIVAILNAAGVEAADDAIPYSFGGDGAAVCVPPALRDDARTVLATLRRIARDTYDLSLRTAVVPVSHLAGRGHPVHVARLRLSEHVSQAVFSGGGLAFAEAALKDGRLPDRFHVSEAEAAATVDLSGLQCRWQEVPSSSDETVALLVKAATDDPDAAASIYADVVATIRDVYGPDPTPHPISADQLSLRTGPLGLRAETRIRQATAGLLDRVRYHAANQLATLAGHLLMTLGVETDATDWSAYKRDLVSNADYRKFDDMLRLVIAGTAAQRNRLEAVLDQRFQDGDLAYGLHVTDRAIVTCMVSEYQHNHRHFVDASDGGYTLAARDLDHRLHTLHDE